MNFDALIDDLRMYRRLFSLAGLRAWFVAALIALALIESLFEGLSLALIIPLMHALNNGTQGDAGFLGWLSGSFASFSQEYRLAAIVGLILTAITLKALVNYVSLTVVAAVYGRVSHALRIGVFKSVMAMPLAMWERERSGRHFNILDNETWRAADALYALLSFIANLSTLVVLTSLLMLLSWRLTLVAVLCMALVPALMRLLNRYIVKVRDFGFKANEALSRTSWTVFNAMRTIRSFGNEEFETRRFTEGSAHVRDFVFRISLITNASAPVTEVLITAVVAILALLIDASRVEVPTLVAFLAILYRLQPRVLTLANLQSRLTALRVPIVEVSKVLSEAGAYRAYVPAEPFRGLAKGITIDNVTFSYFDARRPALADLSLVLERDRSYAVVGLSGAGKSTLLDLLLGFQEAQTGTIHVDGLPLRDIDPTSWRQHIAVVNQDPYLFDDTVRANILYGRPDASDEAVAQAAKVACADEFIRHLPNGYDTVIGERGTQISGGQRQRLSLARALIRDPDILILDEATSALDAVTEREFQTALKSGRPRTVVIVTHRPSMIEITDHVFVLEDGRLVEQGAPAALLAGGKLARIFGLHSAHAL